MHEKNIGNEIYVPKDKGNINIILTIFPFNWWHDSFYFAIYGLSIFGNRNPCKFDNSNIQKSEPLTTSRKTDEYSAESIIRRLDKK
jgi:hypothetical protein